MVVVGIKLSQRVYHERTMNKESRDRLRRKIGFRHEADLIKTLRGNRRMVCLANGIKFYDKNLFCYKLRILILRHRTSTQISQHTKINNICYMRRTQFHSAANSQLRQCL